MQDNSCTTFVLIIATWDLQKLVGTQATKDSMKTKQIYQGRLSRLQKSLRLIKTFKQSLIKLKGLKCKDLQEVFNEATKIQGCINLDGSGYQACIYLGVKISRDDLTKEVKIYDPQKSINYYVEIDKGLYDLFLAKGWRDAVIHITLEKYREKLDKVKESIAKEMNANQSHKRLRVLKEMREQILKKYYKLTQKITNE